MKRRRFDNGAHRALLAGFLDVISCGFAAVLVLGIILSITKAPVRSISPVFDDFRIFVFTVERPAGAPEQSVALRPIISYAGGQVGGNEEMQIQLDGAYQYQPTELSSGRAPFKIELIGFNVSPSKTLSELKDEKRDLNKSALPKPETQAWIVKLSQFRAPCHIRVDVRYINVAPLSGARSTIQVKRTIFPTIREGSEEISPAVDFGMATQFDEVDVFEPTN
jgi:hypothetical protein